MGSVLKSMLRLAAVVATGVMLMGNAAAADYPDASKSIRWIVPYPPGGGSDFVARYLSTHLKEHFKGQPVVVENRAGGATVIGMQATATAPADGYTIALATDTLVASQFFLKSVPYKPSDFAPVYLPAASPMFFLVKPDAPVNTFEEAIQWMKDNDGKLTYATWGHGSTAHLAMEDLSDRIGVDLIHVPYQGASPSVVAMLGGQVDILLASANIVMQHMDEGRLKALAVSTKNSIPQKPEIPPISAVLPGFDYSAWMGIVAPKDTPKETVELLSETFSKLLENPEVVKAFTDRGEIIIAKKSDAFGQLINEEYARIKSLTEKRNLSVTD